MVERKVLELRIDYLELSKQLDSDSESIDEAWDAYEKVKFAYNLEGSQMHWLMCALYMINRKNKILAGEFGENIKLISLAKLLRLSKLNFRQFLSKSHKLHVIVNYPKDYCEEIDRVERDFNVTSILFSKYKTIYLDLFKNPFLNVDSNANQRRTRYSKKSMLKSDDLFKFCWLLFIYVKEKFPAINGDLVNSYHLLLCCINLIYINVLASNRNDLFNRQLDVKKSDLQIFNENLNNTNDEEDEDDENSLDTNQSINLIIDDLCQHHDGLVIETKTINEHYFKTHIKYLIKKKLLYCSPITFLGLLECNPALSNEKSNFEINCRNLNAFYEEYIINYGDIDERMFLNCIGDGEFFNYHAENYCFFDGDNTNENDFDTMKPITDNDSLHKLNHITIQGNRKMDKSLLLDDLNTLINNYKSEPSDSLIEFLNTMNASSSSQSFKNENIIDFVNTYVNDFLKTPYTNSISKRSTNKSSNEYRYIDYHDQALTLYFRELEVILINEKKRLLENYQSYLNKLLLDELFHKLLFSCCVEIVHFSHNIEETFPWILNTFNIESYHLIKIIEIFIRSEENLSREQIRHLNSIETKILETLVWKRDSLIWSLIKDETVPGYDEVCLINSSIPSTASSNDLIINLTPNIATSHASTSSCTNSPVKHPAITRVVCSNTNTSMSGNSDLRITSSQIKKSDTIITTTTTTTTTTNNLPNKSTQNERILLSPVTTKRTTVICTHPQSQQSIHNDLKSKRRRNSSIGIFFRKFYHLATIRINCLVENLDIPDSINKKIWNIFEHSIRNHIDLLKDRHLDQLIMCTIHVGCKICNLNKQFQDIIKSYRLKSTTYNSNVYRNVLIRFNDSNNEIRGDLIQFYNEIYINPMKMYLHKLATNDTRLTNNILLSPVPKINIQSFSPRKINEKQSVYISPCKTYQGQAQRPKLTYSFNNSSYKDLEEINEMIKKNDIRVRTNKRRLLSDSEVDDESDSSQNKSPLNLIHLNKRLQSIQNDRLNNQ